MRTRSTRFFVILLHLLGVSNHHLPSWYYDLVTGDGGDDRDAKLSLSFYSGIRGVHPHSIVLERLDLDLVGGLDGVEWLDQPLAQHMMLNNNEGGTPASDASTATSSSTSSSGASTPSQGATREPFWLQDARDGKCLGPSGGFSECGDATLWFIMRRSTQGKSLRMGFFGVEETPNTLDEEEPYRYALQIADMDYEQRASSSLLTTTKTSAATTAAKPALSWLERRQQQRQQDCLVPSFVGRGNPFWRRDRPEEGYLELGSCKKSAWSWRVDDKGVLYLPADNRHRGRDKRRDARRCLRRLDKSSGAVLADCRNETLTDNDSFADNTRQLQRLVQFSLVRYHATTNAAATTTASSLPSKRGRAAFKAATFKEDNDKRVTSPIKEEDMASLPSNVDKAHSHASRPVRHAPLLEMNLATRPLLSQVSRKESESSGSPFAALKDTNPILFLGESRLNGGAKSEKVAKPPMAPPGSYKPRRIEVHPYIEASRNEIWIDPQTGLEYPTDLCGYLGHDRKESGRHTLMGVGQYTKTMLKIKVYGIALYLSKRDVLADPVFKDFAGMSADELRKRPDFYEYLRSDASIDRTLFIKTNMQLSTETMRSSLDADWKMLTQEAKDLLIDTSLRARPADDNMLADIQREGNPSRCSCAQTAPDQYEPDQSCCARGTEMAFTWRKNGNIEIRINGRVMDIFERPEIARGIFFEYLRLDDPFSLEFIERAVDGFPFLLAPLAQVQGITAPVPQNHSPKVAGGNVVLKALGGAAESFSSHAMGVAGAMQHGATHAMIEAANSVHSASEAARHLAEQMDRNRQALWRHISSLDHHDPMKLIADFISKSRNEAETSLLNETETSGPADKPVDAPHGRVFRPSTSRWFGETLEAPDEIAPIMHPTMNKTILSLVHLYLLLLLIVSFPGTQSNRTIFVVRRSPKLISLSSRETSLVKQHISSFPEKDLFNKNNLRLTGSPLPIGAKEAAGTIGGDLRGSPGPEIDRRQHGDCFLSKENNASSRSSKRFFSRARKALKPSRSTRSADCPPSSKSSLSDDASVSSISPEPFQARNCKSSATNESMKKSLSYFL